MVDTTTATKTTLSHALRTAASPSPEPSRRTTKEQAMKNDLWTFSWDTAYGRVSPTDAIPAKHVRPGMTLDDGKAVTATATDRRRTTDTDAVFVLAGTWRTFAPGQIVRVKRTK